MYALMNSHDQWLNEFGTWGGADDARIVPPELVPNLLRQHGDAVAFLVVIVAPPADMRVAA